MCKSGCNLDDRCINNVKYLDDIYFLVSSAISLQQMLDVVSKPKNSRLYYLNVRLYCNILEFTIFLALSI